MINQTDSQNDKPFTDPIYKPFTDCKPFWVRFKKRSDGSVREMYCTLDLSAHKFKKGPEDSRIRSWEAAKLLLVWDLEKKGLRSIPLENIIEIRYERDKEWVKVEPGTETRMGVLGMKND